MKFAMAFDEAHADSMSVATGLACDPEDDKATQSGKEDADINVLLKRFAVTGQMPVPNMEPFYGDFTGIDDYQSALNRVMEANTAFMGLSAEVRNKFENDPGKLMVFLDDPDNYAEAERLGLLAPYAEEVAPQRVVVENFPKPGVEPEAK